MKVLMINTVYGQGSTGRIAKEIGNLLDRQNDDFVVAYGRGKGLNDGHSYRIGSDWDNIVHAALSRITDRTGFYSCKATKDLLSFIKRYSPDVIHLNNLHGYYINIELLFSYLKTEYKGKIIWTLHDCWSFTGHCVHYSYAKCAKWKYGCSSCPEKKRYPTSLFLDSSMKNYKDKMRVFTGINNMTIVTPSEWLAEQVKQSYLQDYPIKVINNGIDISLFVPKGNKNDDESQKIILNVADGRDDRKGFSDLIKLRTILPSSYKMMIVGLHEKEIKRLPAGIIGMPRTTNQKELASLYRKSSIFVNPTYEDTFPTVNIEALACGIPVVTYGAGGSPEVIDDNIGAVVEVGDVQALAKAIIKDEFCRTKCRDKAEQYSSSKCYKNYIELYEE